jgi:hypothetical protein
MHPGKADWLICTNNMSLLIAETILPWDCVRVTYVNVVSIH